MRLSPAALQFHFYNPENFYINIFNYMILYFLKIMNIENFSFFFYFSRNNFCLASSEMLNAPSSTLIFLSVVSVVNPKTHPKQFKIASLNELLFSLNIYKYANYIFTRMRAYYDFFESIVSENSSING